MASADAVSVRRAIDFARSGPYFAGLLLVALIAFWPTYLSIAPSASSAYIHLHAATATLWMALLIAQPLAIRAKRLPLHRALGQASYLVAAGVLISIVLLAHNRLQRLAVEAYAIQVYVLYLQVSLAALFALSYGLAIWTRRTSALHARFMICTGLTLIDPVVIRLMFWLEPTPSWNYQWFTFGLTDAVFLALLWLERHNRTGRGVFPLMVVVFALAQAPALLGLTDSAFWQAFAAWFAALPLT